MFGTNICISTSLVNTEDEAKSLLFSCEIDGMHCASTWSGALIVMALIAQWRQTAWRCYCGDNLTTKKT